MDITVLIGTHGSAVWHSEGEACFDRAQEYGHPVIWIHDPDGTVASVRNECVDAADAQGFAQGWLCFLDADDMLEPGYFDAMAAAVNGTTDLLTPAVRYGPTGNVQIFDDRDMDNMNPCVIGTLIHRTVFEQAGRFWEERAWEDWSLFRRAWLLGSTVVWADAVYQARPSRTGRNSVVSDPVTLRSQIQASHKEWMAHGVSASG